MHVCVFVRENEIACFAPYPPQYSIKTYRSSPLWADTESRHSFHGFTSLHSLHTYLFLATEAPMGVSRVGMFSAGSLRQSDNACSIVFNCILEPCVCVLEQTFWIEHAAPRRALSLRPRFLCFHARTEESTVSLCFFFLPLLFLCLCCRTTEKGLSTSWLVRN